jgi:hypothetical protein
MLGEGDKQRYYYNAGGKDAHQLAIKPTGIAVELVVQSAAPKRGMGGATI